MPKLCSFGCAPSGVPMHRFPSADKFPERFKAWVNLVGGKLETAVDYAYYRTKLVCDIHFTARDRNRNKRLNALAVPSLHLHGTSTREPDISLVSLPSNLHATNTGTSAREPDVSLVRIPSNLHATNTGTSAREPDVSLVRTPCNLHAINTGTSAREPDVSLVRTPCNLHATNTGTSAREPDFSFVSQPSNLHSTNTDTIHGTATASAVMMDHNYSKASGSLRKAIRIGSTKSSLTYNYVKVKALSTKVKQLRSEISRLRKRGLSFKSRLANAAKLSQVAAFQQVVKNLKRPAQLFVHMQLQSAKKSKGRRFTMDEKILALSMYKKSPKAYSLLYKYFTLPSAKAMKRLLSQIKLCPGINPIVFEKIKKTVLEKDTADRLCSLMFDEMSLTPQIFYNKQKDAFEGFATTKDTKFADHALVFMVKGLKHNFKQPVAYYFTNALQKVELKTLLKCVALEVQKSGLIIINTVCDQSSVNVGAITDLINDTRARYLRLGREWRHDFFRVNGQKIIPLFDAPHLIKGIRNNLLTKDMAYTSNNKNNIVKWDYYQQVYAADKSKGELRLLNKITEEHIVPEKINKMRVKSATQIFSHSFAVVTDHLIARGDLPEECKQLIDITLLLDNLFDSLNVSSFAIPNGKIYKGPIRRHSPHHQLWLKSKEILKTVKFIQKKVAGNKVRFVETTIPSVFNLIKTIEGMEAICKVLFDKYGYDAILTRNFNQDPIENFFGNIRSYGARNNAPNTVSFVGAFKALLLNNYNTPHSKRANCEEDTNKCLQTLSFYVTEKPDATDVPEEDKINFTADVLIDYSKEPDAGQRNYVCGWVLTKCLKNVVKSCKHCRQDLIDTNNENINNNSFIKAKEYNNKKWLCYPNELLQNYFHDLQNMTGSFLKKRVPKQNVRRTINSFADVLVDTPFKCSIHKEKLKEHFFNLTVTVILHSWCRSINRILTGKITYNGEDETKLSAQLYYDKHKHYKNKK